MTLEQLSTVFLEAAKMEKNLEPLVNIYSDLEFEDIVASVRTDEDKKSFWINTYNAFTLFLLRKNNGAFGNRPGFFRDKHFKIAGVPFSLDDIEHRILRRAQPNYSVESLNNIWLPAWHKKLMVSKLDFRIHFALNCGATSCPPIKFYTASKIEEQLDLATSSYLQSEIIFDDINTVVFLPALFKWFADDFGNESKIIEILKKYQLILPEAFPSITYTRYNWEISNDPFKKLTEEP